ncbi:MAG: DUF169 domain-containing protein [Desulfovibrionaceae bacterium]|nr:DUF169 domain-containing protein [Desulfovibrionaceae bacterium]
MTNQEKLNELFTMLGLAEEPLGIAYVQTPPKGGTTLPEAQRHSCIINYLRMARRKKTPVWFAPDRVGCMGGWLYLGFSQPTEQLVGRISNFVTTGFPGREGEHYLPTPASMLRFLDELDIQPAPAPYCVAQPLSAFAGDKRPDLVCFFVCGEALTGLGMLAGFALDDHHAVQAPFGAGCSNIFAWPLHYQRKGQRKAVIGGMDPSCRPYVGTDELTFTVTADVLESMLEAAPHSFLGSPTWNSVLKKIAKSDSLRAQKA